MEYIQTFGMNELQFRPITEVSESEDMKAERECREAWFSIPTVHYLHIIRKPRPVEKRNHEVQTISFGEAVKKANAKTVETPVGMLKQDFKEGSSFVKRFMDAIE